MSLFRKQSDPLPSIFPTYLLPSLPFRRNSRQSSTDSNVSSVSSVSATGPNSNPFGRSLTPVPAPLPTDEEIVAPADKYLAGTPTSSTIACASPKCSAELALTSQIISKGFMGRHGRAYLVQGAPVPSKSHVRSPSLPNTYLGKAVTRNLVTGQHVVSDLNCAICGASLGWKYVEASEESQRYKVGKFILETKRVRIGVRWDVDDNGHGVDRLVDMDGELELPPTGELRAQDTGELEFDSQDEDECEDLFAGVWSPALAARRRTRKSERYRRKAGRVFVPPARASNDSLV